MTGRGWRIRAVGLLLVGATLASDLATIKTVEAAPPDTVSAALALVDGPGADLDRRRAAAVAWLTARCMAGRGFVHIAVVEPPMAIPDGDLDPLAWAERWGFGVSTSAAAPAPTLAPDPNLRRIAALPIGTRQAALRAWLGHDETPGCAGLAASVVHGLRDRALRPLRPALAALAADVERDAEVRAALARWQACAGTRAERDQHLAGLLEAFARRAAASRDRPSALRAVQQAERRAAVTVARCDLAYVAVRADVRRRLEAPFVLGHRPLLTAIGERIRRVEAAYPDLPRSAVP